MSSDPADDRPLTIAPKESLELEPYPQPGAGDYFSQIVKLGISAIPDFGGPASELFGMITAPLLGRRRDQWLEDLRAGLNDLSRRVESLTIHSLAHNERFVSAVVQATPAAVRTEQQVKREALRNAVLNVAAGTMLEPDRQAMFLNLVDEFTATHLQILQFFRKPDSGDRIVFAKRERLTDQVALDLSRRGLARDPRPYVAQNRESATPLVTYAWEVTPLGHEFLQFISAPA